MSAFLSDLFRSIFTPGPTHTLVVATNATFACLQVLLFILLIGTYSVHFLILSGLSAGLWWAINWFVAEINEGHGPGPEKKRPANSRTDDSGAEADTVLCDEDANAGHKKEPLIQSGIGSIIRERAGGYGVGGGKSDGSTEDEWERVSANEKKLV